MNLTKEQFERLAGDRFVTWYNDEHGCNYLYAGRPNPAPDLEYRDGERVLRVEVTEASYDDGADAIFKWKHLRGDADAPRVWAGVEPDEALAVRIGRQLTKKAAITYGSDCALVVHIDPTMSNPGDIQRILADVPVPAKHSFQGIYVAGFFGFSSDTAPPGYKCWRLYEA